MESEANIFVLIDALGWEWVKSHPFLESIAPYRRRLRSVLGYSTAAIPSILTGLYPEQHGRLTLFHAANGSSPFKRLSWVCAMPPALTENRYVRHAVKRIARRANGFEGYFQLYGVPLRYLPSLDICEKRDIYQPGGIPGVKSIFDSLTEHRVPYAAYCYHQGDDRTLAAMMRRELSRREKKVYFLYLAQIDAFLHENADNPAAVARFLDGYSEMLSELHAEAARNYERVRLCVFADHGMAPTVATLDVKAILEGLPFSAPRDYLVLLDSTMARFWFFSPGAREAVVERLARERRGRWLGEEDLKSLRAWFPDRRYGEEIFLTEQGVVIAPSFMGVNAAKGMHGFHPDAPHSYAAFMSSEEVGSDLQEITDVCSLMLTSAGVISGAPVPR